MIVTIFIPVHKYYEKRDVRLIKEYIQTVPVHNEVSASNHQNSQTSIPWLTYSASPNCGEVLPVVLVLRIAIYDMDHFSLIGTYDIQDLIMFWNCTDQMYIYPM